MEKTVEVLIIGAGTAGLSAVSEVRRVTDDFLLVNSGPYGTTCARVGCMPSKVFIHAAQSFHKRKNFPSFGIRGSENLSVSVPEVMKRVRSLRDRFVSGVMEGASSDTQRNLRGTARFLEPGLVKVDNHLVKAKKVIIATGSAAFIPEPWKRFGSRLITTDDFFELEDLPESMAVIGLGAIGCELGQAASRLGVDLVGIDQAHTIAGLQDPEIRDHAVELISGDFPIWLGNPAELEDSGGRLLIRAGGRTATVDKALVSMGRRPNLQGLGLEDLGIPLKANGIPEFDPNTMQVGDYNIFLAGDVAGEPAVLHEARDEGKIAGFNSVQGDIRKFRRKVSMGICFTEPQIAFCGQRYHDLENMGTITGRVDFSSQSRALVMGENSGALHVYACSRTGKILGAEMIAPQGEHLAHLLAWSMEGQADVIEFLRLPFYHPVIEEGLGTALREIVKKLGRSGSDMELAGCSDSCLDVLC